MRHNPLNLFSDGPTMPDTPPLSHITPRDKAEILAQALPYIRKFHGKTLVIKYGGNAMTDPALQQDFAEDVVLLKLVGMNPVVVHGGGPQIDERAEAKMGKKGTFIQGMRVTDAETMEVVEWVLAGEVQQDIVGLINKAGGKAVGLTGRDGGLIRARSSRCRQQGPGGRARHRPGRRDRRHRPQRGQGAAGRPVHPGHQPDRLRRAQRELQHQRRRGGRQAGQVLKAEKLVMLTNTPGVLDKAGKLLTDLTARQIDELFADGTISGGMLPKIAGALDAAKSGVNAVHIIDGRVPHAMLLEILTDQAYGTMIRSH
jgi:acetylglutamate kinase